MNQFKKHIFIFLFLTTIQSRSAFSFEITNLLPKSNDVKGWVRQSEPRIFANSKLWEYIDGGADVYIDYGFQQVATIDLENDKRSVTVDVYEMKNLEGAFGIYARERAPSYHFISIGIEGYQEGVSLNFYQHKYYIKLTAFTDDAPTKSALTKISQLISQKIGGQKKQPAILALFPSEGKVKHTENYDVKTYLGRSELREAFSAKYSVKGKTFTLFIISASSQQIVSSRLHSVKPALTQTGFMDKDFVGLGKEILTGKHREAKEMVMTAKDKYLVGVYPVSDVKIVKEFLQTFLIKLK